MIWIYKTPEELLKISEENLLKARIDCDQLQALAHSDAVKYDNLRNRIKTIQKKYRLLCWQKGLLPDHLAHCFECYRAVPRKGICIIHICKRQGCRR